MSEPTDGPINGYAQDLLARAAALDVDPRDVAEDGSVKPYIAPSFSLPAVVYADIADPEGVTVLAGDAPPEQEGDSSIMAGWCPNGDWSGGICRPYNNVRDNWMSTHLSGTLLRVQSLILPGTHNSGADKKAPETASNMTCQDVSPYEQLHAGIRALDLRVHFYSGYHTTDPRRFQIVHGFSTGRTFKGDILDALTRFRADNGGRAKSEIVILDIHEPENFTAAARQEFINLVKSWGGTSLAPHYLKDFNAAQWMALGKNTVLALGGHTDPMLWPGVNQRWIGYSVTSSSDLENFANKVVLETKPADELRALQFHKHVKITLVPDDISDRVMRRSASDDASSAVQGLYIFNTDWSLRHRMVDNCIRGNTIRAGGMRTTRARNSTSGNRIQSGLAVIYEGYNGDHTPVLTLSNTWPFGLAVYIHDATWSTAIDMSPVSNAGGLHSLEMRTGERVAFIMDNSQWKVAGITHTATQQSSYTIPMPAAGELFTFFQTKDGYYAADIQLPATAHTRAIIVIMCNSTYAFTINGQRMVNAQPVHVGSFKQCAVQYAGNGKWNLISVPT